MMFDIGTPSAKVTYDEMPADTQVCNCNGVSKAGPSRRAWKAGCHDSFEIRHGCRRARAWAAAPARARSRNSSPGCLGGEVEDDPSIHYYVPLHSRCGSQSSLKRDRRARPEVGVVRVAGTRKRRASRTPPGSRRWPRCSSPSGRASTTTSGTPASSTTGCTPTSRRTGPSPSCPRCRAACAPPDELIRIGQVAQEVQRAAGETDGRPAGRPRRPEEGGPAQDLERPRLQGRLRLGQELPHLQELHRCGFLPLRPRRLDGLRSADRAALPRHRRAGQAEARHGRLPAQLLRGLRQGCRLRRGRRGQVGDLRRRRGRCPHPQG